MTIRDLYASLSELIESNENALDFEVVDFFTGLPMASEIDEDSMEIQFFIDGEEED